VNADRSDVHPRPNDTALAALVSEAQETVAWADPLAAGLLQGRPGIPDPGEDGERAAVQALADLGRRLELLDPRPDRMDELDRQALVFGLRRAVAGADPRRVEGPLLLERHLQLRLLGLLDAPGDFEPLGELVEAGGRLLVAARRETSPGGRIDGLLALESARRLPALLDACAGAAREAPAATRTRIEAGLGALLQAGAEEAGWLLKVYLPAAADAGSAPAPAVLDPVILGLGGALDRLEADAEEALAEAVVARGAAAPPGADHEPPGGGREAADLDEVSRAWAEAAAAAAVAWGPVPSTPFEVTTAPSWLAGLLPPLSLWQPGALSGAPLRLLVADPSRADLAGLAEVYEAEFIPAAHFQAAARLARLITPAPELQLGWRGHVRAAGAGQSPWNLELAWRAALALAAVALSRGPVTIDQAAGLIAAEAGLPPDQALVQAMTVARRPVAALAFIAGRTEVKRALASRSPAELLSAGPLPAVNIAADR
jgi:hypothetical protein